MTSLTGDRWQRLQSLFHEALALDAAERRAFVARETAGQPTLRRELDEMLANTGHAPDWLADTIRNVARAAAGGRLAGHRMGPYLLIREIGRGGMGVVWEARRDDNEYRKTVALKVAPDWHDPLSFGTRLRAERQILAGLEHPNIARFLDGGTANGLPYFAMEFVEGRPITAFCGQNGLTVRARIALFCQVCDAVDYAHQNLVVHRDLKPANILVTDEGVPKLLDFGIARLLGPRSDAAGATSGMAMWTPDYTSPEQLRGGAVTVRTDVYSLGLILYELLAGEPAQRADTTSPLALDRSICEAEPPPASTRAAARGERQLSRQLKGDLDTIAAKAMAKEPSRRYASAAALRADLQRYLEGRPVEARPAGFASRAWKLARRNRAAVAAGLLLGITVAGGIFATLQQARRAERRYLQVRHLASSLLFGVHDRIQNLAGATEAREWAVKTALDYLDSLVQDSRDDPALAFELATAYLKTGDVQGYPVGANLGHREAAAQSYRKALEIAERLAARDHGPDVQRLLARAHQRNGAMLRSFQNALQGIDEYQRAIAIEEPLYRAHPGDPQDSALLSETLVSLGQAEAGVGREADANRSWTRALEIAARWYAAHPGDDARARLASGHCMVSRGLQYIGDLDGAAQHARDCAAIRQEMAAAHPANAPYRRELMNAWQQTGYVYWQENFLSFEDRTAALPHLEHALALARELAAADPNNTTGQFDLSIAEADLCTTLDELEPARALDHCRAAIAIASQHPAQLKTGAASIGMARALARMHRPADAVRAMRSAAAVYGELVARDPARVSFRRQLLRVRNQLGEIESAAGDPAAALEQHRLALAEAETLASSQPGNPIAQRDLANSYRHLALLYDATDRTQATTFRRRELAIWASWPTIAPSTPVDQVRRDAAARLLAR